MNAADWIMGAVVVVFFIGAFFSKDRRTKQQPTQTEDPNMARIRQMAEWDRFDKNKNERR